MIQDKIIIEREIQLRDWFTHGNDRVKKIIDGLDIGWGGAQRWATAQMPVMRGRHLDLACGYGTFLTQMGWRYPDLELYGLNIDYKGPHRMIHELLKKARVNATLLQADARTIPCGNCSFSSLSCFLGLQDIEIGFGIEGVDQALGEATRVLEVGGTLVLIDEFTFDKYDQLLKSAQFKVLLKDEYVLNIKWNRDIAEQAIKLYAHGWVQQQRNENHKKIKYHKIHKKMKEDMEKQLTTLGYYIPFGPLRMLVLRKIR